MSLIRNGSGRLIQNRVGNPGNFELVVAVQVPNFPGPPKATNLTHYHRDNANSENWVADKIIDSDAASSGSLIQSTFGSNPTQGVLEVLVLEGANIIHYYENSPGGGFSQGGSFSTQATGSPSFIQGNLGKAGSNGNFEAVILEGGNLVHYWRDNSSAPLGGTTGGPYPWTRTDIITSSAAGPGTIIQSNLGVGPGNFEVLVPEDDGNIRHYWRDNSSTWHKGEIVAPGFGQAGLIQNINGNLEAVVLQDNGSNNYTLRYYYRENSNPNLWLTDETNDVITTYATGPGSLIQSTYNDHPPAGGTLEVP
jgi:hypothetical protein